MKLTPSPMEAFAAYTSRSSISELSTLYDGFILDQFGVLHNGSEALPGAVDCVRRLAAAGKRLVILSNTSSPAEATLAKLRRLGFISESGGDAVSSFGTPFLGAITSGDEAARYVASGGVGSGWGGREGGDRSGSEGPIRRALWLTWSEDNPDTSAHPLEFLDRCGGRAIPASSVDDADFVLAHGSQVIRGPGGPGDATETSLGSFYDDGDPGPVLGTMLRSCADRGLPMVCANPDLVVGLAGGRVAHMPGRIGSLYEEAGGVCRYFGKPREEHFEACLKELGLERGRVAHVGDSLRHDVAGAKAASLSSVFVTGGIHLDALGCPLGGIPEDNELMALFEAEGGIVPDHVIPLFRW